MSVLRPRHPGFDRRISIGAPSTEPSGTPYFAGYARAISLVAGEPLDVQVATREEADCFADVYRVVGCEDPGFDPAIEIVARCDAAVKPLRCGQVAGHPPLAPGACDSEGCGWPVSRVLDAIPETWQSGVYLVQFTSSRKPTGRLSAQMGQDALFVLRPARPSAPRLLQIGVATWSAYHLWGNRDLYGGLADDGSWLHELRTHRVSFSRPGIGLGAFNQSLWGPGKGSYLFKFLQWCAVEGIGLDCCTGLDIDAGTIDLDAYELVITVGHDEYWTGPQRDAIEGFVARGGNAAFLGGNLSYWQVRSLDDGEAIECYKRRGGVPLRSHSQPMPGDGEPLDPLYRSPDHNPQHDNHSVTVEFHSQPIDRPPTSLTGVSMRNDESRRRAGEDPSGLVFAGACWWWEDLGGPERPSAGFTVSAEAHWALEGTGLLDGDVFGAEQKVVGFECDGLDVEIKDGRPAPTGCDSPPGIEIVAFADCRHWAETDYSQRPPSCTPGVRCNQAALGGVVTIVSWRSEAGGEVFTAPTTDWVFALRPTIDYTRYRNVRPPVNAASEHVIQITRNAIERLSRRRPS
ncbi:MAG TPA: N,N-dimethylformamidase beta subunit family domain-containing protein [Solirubrobacteraceae bacterium]|jgi:hypothetical protein|nr:N,N-dimethylformamidase beta subunit family domain-containing protein [Solirubrobacteraceae bacterium]